jgi:hypothetical protein
MAKKDKLYEKVYERVRTLATESLKESQDRPDGGAVIAAAQAEALARTVRGFTLRTIKREFHAQFLHGLLNQIMRDVLDGLDYLDGHIVVAERKKKKK